MKKIYALYGSKDRGKSETIKLLFDKLKSLDYEILEIIIPIYGGDIRVVIKINGKIIAIESQGDPNSRIFESLPSFVKIEADIIICATRTRGGTVKLVEKYNKKYNIIWVKKEHSASISSQKSDNDKLAEKIFKMIKANL
ncbi:hypothetical protein [Algoriella sp.]|uniref:hypothetical protein n=1 Tax=Algoriella sp. TaxID=1872434 RepID=UPI002FCB7AC3